MKYPSFFQKFTLASGVELNNRILMAPMTTWSGHPDGTISEEELAYYRRRSAGLGAVITACGYVMPEGKGFVGQFGMDNDDKITSLKAMAQTIQSQGSKAIVQIYHGGRLCPPEILPDQQPVSASGIAAVVRGSPTPRAMTEEDIHKTVLAFGQATRRAILAGFDGVEIHGANGYLLQQFFSPHANRRTDAWGGSLTQRMAFPLAVVDEVVQTVAHFAQKPFIIGYRLSPEESDVPGISIEDTLHFVEKLATKKLDYLHVSAMNFWQGSSYNPNDKKPRAILIQEKVNPLPIIGVGSLRTAEEVLKVIEAGIPLVALGRELLMEPDWIAKVSRDQENNLRTILPKSAQKELVLPDGLWQVIMNSPGWLPVV